MLGYNGRGSVRRALLGWIAVIGVGLIGCSEQAIDPNSTVIPTRQSGAESAADTRHDAIQWHAGDVDSAFAAARATRRPVLLYWGADWCPPCSRLKATVFRRREFVERTRLFVAVDLDGDDPGAMRLGEEFKVAGYPTVVVLSPDREEITRIAFGMETDQYVRALDIALAATQPASAAYAAVLGGVATDSDLRLLAYYSWGQDRERLLPKSQLPAALKALEASYPAHLAVERSRVFLSYLGAYRTSMTDDEEAPPLPGEEQTRARARLLEILEDPALLRANHWYLVYGAHWIYGMVAEPGAAEAEALADTWEAVLARMRKDPATSPVDRLGTLYGTLCLLHARQPDAAPPQRLVRAVRRAVREADRTTTDPYARMDLFASATRALQVAGLYDEAYDFISREVERSGFPGYVMLTLARWAEWMHHPAEAVSWAERAWQEAPGTATRFSRGTSYVHLLVQLTPGDDVRIEDVTIAMFHELGSEGDDFFRVVDRSLRRLETDLREWNHDGSHAQSLDRIHAAVMAICDTLAGDPAREKCRAFLSERSLSPSI